MTFFEFTRRLKGLPKGECLIGPDSHSFGAGIGYSSSTGNGTGAGGGYSISQMYNSTGPWLYCSSAHMHGVGDGDTI